MNVLLIEDNPMEARMVCRIFKEVGALEDRIEHVDSLQRGLEFIQDCVDAEQSIDVILLDLGLPDRRGPQVVSEVRSHACEGTSIVVLTGVDCDSTGFESVSLGADDFLCKSGLEAKELMRVIRYAAERRRSQQQLHSARHAADIAEASNRAKSEFLANISHEIRTPMNAILGFTQLMAQDPDQSDSNRQYLDTICNAGEHLMTLLNDVIDMSRLELGSIEREPEAFNLRQLLHMTQNVFGSEALKSGLNLKLEFGAGLPEFITGDAPAIRQILVNLIGNAVKYTEAGEIVIRAELIAKDEAQARVCFSVSDTGIGIAPENLERVFDPFEQAKRGDDGGGVGLGLALCKKLSNTMGSRIEVTSELDRGSTFWFEVDFADPSQEVVDASRIPRTELKMGDRRLKALVVDDNAINRAVLGAILESNGFMVETVEDGKLGVAQFQSWEPNVVLMDQRMPVMDGLEATRRIKATHPNAPVILVSASVDDSDRQLQESGADAFLPKPVRNKDLMQTLSQILGVEMEQGNSETPDNVIPMEVATPSSEFLDVWRERLLDAVYSCDYSRLLELENKISPMHPQIAASLRHWILQFDYQSISNYLKAA